MLSLVELARARSRAEFLIVVPPRFLVLEGESRTPSPVGFATALAPPGRTSTPVPVVEPQARVLPIAKVPGHPYPERIAVGRTRNCDVVLRDPSVSKLHAHFSDAPGGALQLVDVASHNGTRVNGRALAPHRPMVLVVGDLVAFGNVHARLVDASGLYDLLRAASAA